MAPEKAPAPKSKPAPKSDPLAEHVAKHSKRIAALEADLEQLKRAIAGALGIEVE